MVDIVYVRELTLFATNDADLYRSRITPITANLARKVANGSYDLTKAIKLWQYAADDAAKRYQKEYGAGHIAKDIRVQLAHELQAYYADDVQDQARDITLRKTWTISAIREANMKAGSHFFDRETMKHFGETVRSFRVSVEDGEVFVVNAKNTVWMFDPKTHQLLYVG